MNRLGRSALITAGAVALSGGACWLALEVASGATRVGAGDVETEFLHGPTYLVAGLAAPVLGVAAVSSVRMALFGLGLFGAITTLTMAETVQRYARSGWGDGLEVLGFLVPILMIVLALVCVVVGGAIGRSRRNAVVQLQ